jgi:hypothetical protein
VIAAWRKELTTAGDGGVALWPGIISAENAVQQQGSMMGCGGGSDGG